MIYIFLGGGRVYHILVKFAPGIKTSIKITSLVFTIHIILLAFLCNIFNVVVLLHIYLVFLYKWSFLFSVIIILIFFLHYKSISDSMST